MAAEQRGGAEAEKAGRGEEMTPWEQHAGVLSIPRFDYTAPSTLLHRSASGFLITCPIRREKSATKEVMSILEKYTSSCTSSASSEESHDADKVCKRRKLCPEEGEPAEAMNSNSSSDDKVDDQLEGKNALSLVKLMKSGLLLLTLSNGSSLDPVEVLSKLKHSLECGALKSPLWCHRIFPIQATCVLNEKELSGIVADLVLQFVNSKKHELSTPAKFAVGYNRRGLEETVVKLMGSDSDNTFALLDRNKCISVGATAVKASLPDSVVDLKFPELCVLVELLPVLGVPNGAIVAAVSVLPGNLVNSKPRLCVKALTFESKGKDAIC
ncbi:hypothetical protein Droror1_Dr00014322 [Drosera rotundifolia]